MIGDPGLKDQTYGKREGTDLLCREQIRVTGAEVAVNIGIFVTMLTHSM